MATNVIQTLAKFKPTSNDCVNVVLFLCNAAKEGVHEMAQAVINSGFDINAKGEGGETPLHYTAGNGREHHVMVLIALGIDVNAKDDSGSTPLHVSAENGQLKTMKALIEAGADINAKGSCGKTPLHCSSEMGLANIVKCLVDVGANVKSEDNYGNTALHYSAANDHLDIVEILLFAGAEANAKNKMHETPLHCSALHGHPEILKTLFVSGADANAKMYGIGTPLHCSAYHGHLLTVEALIEAGVDVNAEGEFGETPLIMSVQQEHLEIVKALIAAGADVNKREGIRSFTALHEAAQTDNVEIIKALIAGGADINMKDRGGETPLSIARGCDEMDICKVLIKHTILMNPDSNEIKNIPKPRKLLAYWKACKQQVTKMRSMKLGDSSVSFYDFLTETDENKVAFYCSVDKFGIRNGFQRAQHKRMFPMYGEEIEDQFRKGNERAVFLDEITDKMTVFFPKKLPIEVCRMIIEYLSDDDLTCFLFSFEYEDSPGPPPYKKIKL